MNSYLNELAGDYLVFPRPIPLNLREPSGEEWDNEAEIFGALESWRGDSKLGRGSENGGNGCCNEQPTRLTILRLLQKRGGSWMTLTNGIEFYLMSNLFIGVLTSLMTNRSLV